MTSPVRLEPPVPARFAGRFFPAAAVAVVSACLALTSCLLDLGALRKEGADGASGAGAGAGGGCSGAAADCGCKGDCHAGVCAPSTVAEGPSEAVAGPRGITATGDALYWVNQEGGTVMALGPGDAAPRKLTTAVSPVSVVADANGNVFWIEQDGIWRCPSADCEQKKARITGSDGKSTIRGIALQGQTVFWTDQGVSPALGKVKSCDVTMCAPRLVAESQSSPTNIAVFGDKVFWAIDGSNEQNGEVHGALTSGMGPVAQITSGISPPIAIALDDKHVYWTNAMAGTVLRCVNELTYCPKDNADTIATEQSAPVDLALSGGVLYWASGDGTIRSCPASGCETGAPEVRAMGRKDTQRIALNQSCLFWTENGGVFKVPRN